MIHRLNVPPISKILLLEIVAIQRHLLEQLCNPSISSSAVDVEWVVRQLAISDIPEAWAREFAERDDLLHQMQIIADLLPSVKTELWEAFTHDFQFDVAYQDATRRPFTLRGCTFLENRVARPAVRLFFKLFYDPNFYRENGYPIGTDTPRKLFHKEDFLAEFNQANAELNVCPLCDGALKKVEVDHFYPKTHFPTLSCHPLNLVPICGECNNIKGQKKPPIQPPSVANHVWFHPYLCALADWTKEADWPTDFEFHVRFRPDNNGNIVPEPWSNNSLTRQRLEKVDALVHLKKQWLREYKGLFQVATTRIRRYRFKTRYALTREGVGDEMGKLAADAKDAIGRDHYGILKYHHWREATNINSHLFNKLWDDTEDIDELVP